MFDPHTKAPVPLRGGENGGEGNGPYYPFGSARMNDLMPKLKKMLEISEPLRTRLFQVKKKASQVRTSCSHLASEDTAASGQKKKKTHASEKPTPLLASADTAFSVPKKGIASENPPPTPSLCDPAFSGYNKSQVRTPPL